MPSERVPTGQVSYPRRPFCAASMNVAVDTDFGTFIQPGELHYIATEHTLRVITTVIA